MATNDNNNEKVQELTPEQIAAAAAEKAAAVAAAEEKVTNLETSLKAAKLELRTLKGTSEHKSRVGAGVTMAERVAFLDSFIKAKKSTRKELVAELDKKFPQCTHDANATVVSDGFNATYTKFSKVLVKDEKGIVSYSK